MKILASYIWWLINIKLKILAEKYWKMDILRKDLAREFEISDLNKANSYSADPDLDLISQCTQKLLASLSSMKLSSSELCEKSVAQPILKSKLSRLKKAVRLSISTSQAENEETCTEVQETKDQYQDPMKWADQIHESSTFFITKNYYSSSKIAENTNKKARKPKEKKENTKKDSKPRVSTFKSRSDKHIKIKSPQINIIRSEKQIRPQSTRALQNSSGFTLNLSKITPAKSPNQSQINSYSERTFFTGSSLSKSHTDPQLPMKRLNSSFAPSERSARAKPAPIRSPSPIKFKNFSDDKFQTFINLTKKNDFQGVKSISHQLSIQIINKKDEKGNTALYLAALNGCLLLVYHLWQIGAKLNVKCENKNTELHAAFIGDNADLIYFLIEKGSNLLVINDDSMTPIDCASPRILERLGFDASAKRKGRKLVPTIAMHRLKCGKYSHMPKKVSYDIEPAYFPILDDSPKGPEIPVNKFGYWGPLYKCEKQAIDYKGNL
ncbi:unnamed protein product [Blepharisma stoltei]|uniref:Uncharacterized protein n=1 Tax=Blepharisma stoltei TaxID=1481888 RepID=A0AAU9IZI5_9CILI|nr:unnamed protein product [Blepharisma stoltei]